MTWLGLDGEGLGRHPHRYVMLCVSDSTARNVDCIEDVNGLPTHAVLSWLLKLPAARSGRNSASNVNIAGYYLSYDWTMILKDLPNRLLYRLLRPELRAAPRGEGGFLPIHWRGFKLHYLSGMMRITRGDRSVAVWDVGKYYQSRFVVALEQAGFAPPELIDRMKAERGSWTEDDLDRMRDYCFEECKYLARLVEQLESQHSALGLEPRTWHGPGSTASALLAKFKVQDYHAKPPYSEVIDRADRAFFGGRFEQSCIGRRSEMNSYDIRSAYPHAMTTLPCLKHGKWQHRKRAPKDGAVALVRYKVKDIGERAWGPLPCRLEDESIVWPRGGSTGWVWSVEWEAAMCHWKGIDYAREHWELVRRCNCEPFGFMQDLYAWRVAHPENKQVGKLAINSGYGKIAQSIGGGSRWSSRVWAGIITATTRARMLDFIGAHADESRLAAIATDGAYSSEVVGLGYGPGLGDWERSYKGDMSFVRPGIYWSVEDILAWYADPSSKTLAEAAAKAVRSRGISRRHLLTQIVGAENAIAQGDPKALLGVTQQFGGARECVYRTPSGAYKRSPLYGQWYETPATLSLRPEPKRDAAWRPPMLAAVESAPYRTGASKDSKLLRVIGSMLEGRIR